MQFSETTTEWHNFTMGIDVGFDLYPPIAPDDEGLKEAWSSFFSAVEDKFDYDPDVATTNGQLVFEVGEHPSLPFHGTEFRRFSSKVSGRCGKAEDYIKVVARIAERYFGKRIYYWSEYGDICNMKYSWNDVYAARGLFLEKENSTIPFRSVATAVLTGFEQIHIGMDGLRLKEVKFPDDDGYYIVQEGCGFGEVNRIEDWTSYAQGHEEVRAYWATRANNNCATLNGALIKVLRFLERQGIDKISITLFTRSSMKEESIKISSITSRKIGLTPHHVGTIVEPPLTSRVPSSPDGETFHEFLVGMTEKDGIPIALDCAVAQFGLDDHFPYSSAELVPYLKVLGKHRMLKGQEAESGLEHPFVLDKVTTCAMWAIKALTSTWSLPRKL